MNTTTVVPHRQKMSQILPMDWLLELTLSTFLWWKEVAEASSAIRRVLCGDSRKEPNLGFLIDLVRQKKLVHMCGEGSFIPSICSRFSWL